MSTEADNGVDPQPPDTIQLSDREKMILQCIVDVWQDAESPMYGDVSYKEVLDILQRLGLQANTLIARLALSGSLLAKELSNDR